MVKSYSSLCKERISQLRNKKLVGQARGPLLIGAEEAYKQLCLYKETYIVSSRELIGLKIDAKVS